MPDYDVVIKQIEPQLVASVRDTLPNYPAVGRLFDEVYGYPARSGVNGLEAVGVAIWHDDEYKTSDIDGEAAVLLKQPIPEDERVKVHQLPAATMASVVHKGAYNTLSQAYEAVGRWTQPRTLPVLHTARSPGRRFLRHRDPVPRREDIDR